MPNGNIFRKIRAVIISGTIVFSSISVNAQYLSAQGAIFPETMIIEDFTGYFQRSFNIDIDNDGQKEKIGYYYIGSKASYAISDVYYVYDDSSEPYTLYKRISNEHMAFKLHVVQDNNTGEIFFGYIYTDMFQSSALYKFSSDKQEQLVVGYFGSDSGKSADGVSLEEYYAYMQNVTFLDEIAYGKGDVDGDVDITISDAITMLSYYAKNAVGLPTEINDIQKSAADMDNDGKITISDATTTLSLYAEHAAGLIDTLILPSNVKEDDTCFRDFPRLTKGELESTFYLDIDNDGKKETIGRYDNTNLYPYENTNYIMVQPQPYVFQVYDNGNFYDTFGYDPSAGMVKFNYVLVNDHNINQIYLASIYSRGSGTYCYAGITKEYPVVGGASKPILYVDYSIDATSGSPITTETIEIGYNSVIRQELLDYIDNLEIISPYGDEAESLSVFKHIFDTYGQ